MAEANETPSTTDRIQALADSYLAGGGMGGATINQQNQQTQSLIFNPNIQVGSTGSYIPSVSSGIDPNMTSDQSGRAGAVPGVGVPSQPMPEQLQSTGKKSFFTPTVLVLIAGAAVSAYLLFLR